MKTKQPEALRLAHIFEHPLPPEWSDMIAATKELRRQHAEIEALRTGYDAARLEIAGLQAQLEAIGAGGVEPLRKRECLHKIEEPSSGTLDKIMELADMYAHAAITDGCPFDKLPRNVLRRAIAEALAAAPPQPMAVPDGWKLVPVELDDEIAEAIAMTARCCGGGGANDIWRAALLATPQPPAQAQEDAKDAARYRFLRDGEWRRTDLESVIRLQLSALWDAKIDAAIAAQQGKKP